MEKEKSIAYLNECLKELKAMDDEEFRKRDEMTMKAIEPLSSHAVLGEVSAGQFIQKHFIALKSLLNNSELFAYDDIIEFENVCLKLGISCEVVDGYLR